jgi:DNA repair protein RecO (recombination protein O)
VSVRAPAGPRGLAPPFTGVIVGRQDLGEADRILRLLTAERGRVSVVARGARGARSPWAVLDVGCRVRVTTRASRSGLAPIVTADVEEARVHLRDMLATLAHAQYACEVCGGLAREEHAEERLYGLLETALLVLDAVSEPPGAALLAGLEAKALSFAGLAPALDRCAGCGQSVGDSALPMGASDGAFYPAGGGLRHTRCAGPEDGEGRPVPRELLGAMEAARRTPLRDLVDTGLPPGPRYLLASAIEAHLGRPLASRALLDVIASP